ncbi:MAG: ATP-binding protein [Firmicutes bacterium]|nr:ATP-binding protein [Bacillota bacterium]
MQEVEKKLTVKFHGRIIEQLGIQLYQSPVAAIAELVSNCWDAEATSVFITLPDDIAPESYIEIKDNGTGMTFEQCQSRYLNIGYNTRGNNPAQKTPNLKRPVLGRKGIGKLAGFGISQIVSLETISCESGEKTTFSLELDKLLGDGQTYIQENLELDAVGYEGPDEERKAAHGTVIRLSSLTLSRRPSPDVYLRSLARRFLLHQIAEDFSVTLNGVPLPESELMDQIEFQFPRDYNEKELPDDLIMDDDGWGIEDVANHQVKWRIMFYKTPIGIEDLRGISVYANGKLIQTPFLFNIVGGLSGQHGLEYLSGQIIADYIDEMSDDIISPERQRVRWEHPDALSLHEWGEQRIKTLLRIWKERRAQEKLRIIEEKISPFALRMAKLLPTEQKIVKQALTKIATMESLSGEQFITLSEAILTAWEGGRLQELILQLSTSEEITQEQFFSILLEANVLTALHLAESINTKLLIIQGLEQSITAKDRENAIRDYISRYPLKSFVRLLPRPL